MASVQSGTIQIAVRSIGSGTRNNCEEQPVRADRGRQDAKQGAGDNRAPPDPLPRGQHQEAGKRNGFSVLQER